MTKNKFLLISNKKIFRAFFALRDMDKNWDSLNEIQRKSLSKNDFMWNFGHTTAAEKNIGTFKSYSNRLDQFEGFELNKYLNMYKPKKILEIGSGRGYFSKLLFDKKFVEVIDFFDVSQDIKILEKEISEFKTSINVNFYNNDLNLIKEKYDSIIILNTLHHINDRKEFFKKINNLLNHSSSIFLSEPTNALVRKHFTLKKILYQKEFFTKPMVTHHPISRSEIKRLTKDNFVIKYMNYKYIDKIKKNFLLNLIKGYYISSFISIVLKKV